MLQAQQQQSNPLGQQTNQYNAFMQNPFGFLAMRGMNIPYQYQSSPRDAVQYLMNQGQVSQERYNQLMTQVSQMGYQFK